MEAEELPQLPGTEVRLNVTINLEEGDCNRDEVSPKLHFLVILSQPKSDPWFLSLAKVFWDEADWSSPPERPKP